MNIIGEYAGIKLLLCSYKQKSKTIKGDYKDLYVANFGADWDIIVTIHENQLCNMKYIYDKLIEQFNYPFSYSAFYRRVYKLYEINQIQITKGSENNENLLFCSCLLY